MLNRIFFFSDIDDTLMQTRRKTDFTKSTVVGAYTKEGEENSFFYEGTKLFIDTLIASNIMFIPTTARNLNSYNRTVFAKNAAIKYVVLNFGGLILVDGKADREWERKMDMSYTNIMTMESLCTLLNHKLESVSMKLVIKIIDGFYISIYNKFNLDNKNILKEIKENLKDFLSEHKDFYLYENDNSFAILPNFLNKKFAVEYLIKNNNPILTLGAGDNMSDLDFMNLCSFRMIPKKVPVRLV
ncbi:MAG: hypothetical protein Q9M39_04755 [Sulfurovum sp.]|nr:hypothetical protein [Sulfurovum sp.]